LVLESNFVKNSRIEICPTNFSAEMEFHQIGTRLSLPVKVMLRHRSGSHAKK
jgi:hypothetical protein